MIYEHEDTEMIIQSDEEDIVYQSSGSDLDSDNELFHQSSSDENRPATRRGYKHDRRRGYKHDRRHQFGSTICGKPVCCKAFGKLLGVGDSTIEKVRNGVPAFTNSSRAPRIKHPLLGFVMDSGRKWVSVLMFCCLLYMSCAECLPTHMDMPRGQASEMPLDSGTDPDAALRAINKYMNNLESYTSDPQNNIMGPGTFVGGKRFLQHCTRTELFWEYRAHCEANGDEPAGRTVFFTVINKVIGSKKGQDCFLGFRKSSEHAQCDTCFRPEKRIIVSVFLQSP